MRGDFSRRTFDRTKHYSGVLMQQGRVQVDADWNEQGEIIRHLAETEARDVIGACGAPLDGGGFAISPTPDNADLLISAGRIYVDGILCELEDGSAVGATISDDAVIQIARWVVDGRAWEPGQWIALFGIDTPSNLQTFQIRATDAGAGKLSLRASVAAFRGTPNLRARRLLTYLNQPDTPLSEQLADRIHLVYLDVWRRHITALDDPHVRETALGGPDTASRLRTIAQVKLLNLDDIKPQDGSRITCTTPIPAFDALIAPSTGMINARTAPPEVASDTPCLIPPETGFLGLENQLYRVEIHQGGRLQSGATGLTFKWSRDNGSVITAITAFDNAQVTVDSVGPDSVLGFADQQTVEVLDDAIELTGQPGLLTTITDVQAAARLITLHDAPVGVNIDQHAILRRWDGTGAVVLPAKADDWISLENGVQIQFTPGTYRTGDYWLIPARTATGEIEWPPHAVPNTMPLPQPPAGVRHHYCRLAIAEINRKANVASMRDCRPIFQPLPRVIDALHITKINWENDQLFPIDRLLNEGLVFQLDGQLFFDRSKDNVNQGAIIVCAEVPPILGNTRPGELRQPLLIEGNVQNSNDLLIWRPRASLGLIGEFLNNVQGPVRVRVTVKGHVIWTNITKRIYLDGQAFGRSREDGSLDLILPTGAGSRASDFESWFFLQATRGPLHVQSVNFLRASGETSSFGIINVPPIPLNVSFGRFEDINVIEITFNRAVRVEGLGRSGTPQSVIVEMDIANVPTHVVGDLSAQGNVVRFTAADPPILVAVGVVRLFGHDANEANAPAVRAADDGTLLDGDFDGQPGGDFTINFRVAQG